MFDLCNFTHTGTFLWNTTVINGGEPVPELYGLHMSFFRFIHRCHFSLYHRTVMTCVRLQYHSMPIQCCMHWLQAVGVAANSNLSTVIFIKMLIQESSLKLVFKTGCHDWSWVHDVEPKIDPVWIIPKLLIIFYWRNHIVLWNYNLYWFNIM
jgi:hypothetical protein